MTEITAAPCFWCGGKRPHVRTADNGDKGYDCSGCGAYTWDYGLASPKLLAQLELTDRAKAIIDHALAGPR